MSYEDQEAGRLVYTSNGLLDAAVKLIKEDKEKLRGRVQAADIRITAMGKQILGLLDKVAELELQVANYEKAFERDEVSRPAPDKSWIEMEQGS